MHDHGQLAIRDSGGQFHPVDVVIDTGFSGELMLPSHLVASLRLGPATQGRGMLADGSIQFYNEYRAVVDWDGQARDMEVMEIGPVALLGMAALHGHDLRVAVVPGGRVEIEALPGQDFTAP